MPGLGKYTVVVLSSYLATLVLLAAIIGVSLWQARRVLRQMNALEAEPEAADD